MKTYEQLTPDQQKAAVNKELASLLEPIIEGAIRFNDKLNHDTLQKRIDTAIEKANKMQTPWFAHEYILDTCREDLEGMAQVQAEDAVYLEAGEHAISISSLK
jgi:hypothetical protein